MTSTSKFNMDPNGGIFDVSPENDRASPNVKTTTLWAVSAHMRETRDNKGP